MSLNIDGPGPWKLWQILTLAVGLLLLAACIVFMVGLYLEWWQPNRGVLLMFVPVAVVAYVTTWVPFGHRYGYPP